MKPGEVFDPVHVTRELKLYPADVVDARTDLGDGPKRLYAQLFQIARTIDRRRNPWTGFLYTSEKFLAGRLGKSESQVRRDSAVLRSAGLVRVERPNKTENNRYFFLWDAAFDSADMRCQEPSAGEDDSAYMRSGDSADVSAHICPDSADMHGHDSAYMRGPIKEKQLQEATTEGSVREVRDGFLKFQAAYPEPKRKIKVDSSCRAYVSVIDGKPGEHARLMAGLERYKASADWQRSLSRDQGRYIPTMEKFIFERRYLDHPPPADEEAPDEYRTPPSLAAKGQRWDPALEEFVPVESVQ